ncbi:hypothetical protein PPL_10798 [Heterostelium album PN500]|uniref:Reverse transcriptase domain-containing protein n=1 Tax=Heterostelium pallidum (strain ATCC 26659 / Pp 5 / PN500) TaxID=670386 RepID=D3BS08_HETP5|nr:hypothetical protein PPL_10798 [Heterostelium album PN500]EFA75745.1 hypothetical protein PPL_10798 [Heterostelium album PN500]|eukprot:XP_020427879.1 hypothetical protein PPL_10798 [Heterostelium album PN500]
MSTLFEFYKKNLKLSNNATFMQLIQLESIHVRLYFPKSNYVSNKILEKLYDLFIMSTVSDPEGRRTSKGIVFNGRIDRSRLNDLHVYCSENLSINKPRKIVAYFPSFNFLKVSAITTSDSSKAIKEDEFKKIYKKNHALFSHVSSLLPTKDNTTKLYKASTWVLYEKDVIISDADYKDEESGYTSTLTKYVEPTQRTSSTTTTTTSTDKKRNKKKNDTTTVRQREVKDSEDTNQNKRTQAPAETNHVTITSLNSYFNKNNNNNKIITTSNGQGTGVAIISHSKHINLYPSLIDPNGRFILCTIRIFNNSFNLLHIYAPASKPEQRLFADQLFNNTSLWLPNHIDICTGDFNCIPGDSSPLSTILDFLCDDHDLIDLDSTNNSSTWKRGDTEKRLDRIYCKFTIETSNFQLHPRALSDHSPITTNIKITPPQLSQTQWRLDKETSLEPEVQSLINNIITTKNINNIEDWIKVKSLIIECYINYQKKRKRIKRNAIINLLKTIDSNLPNNIIQSAKLDLIKLQTEERNLRDSIRKVNQQLNGEIPSRLLTAKLAQSKKDTNIVGLRLNETTVTSNLDDMVNIMEKYYRSLFRNVPDDPTIHNRLLNEWKCEITDDSIAREFTTEEITETINSSNPWKSPGPDGLGLWFYRAHCDVIAPILTKLYNQSLNSGNPLPSEFKVGTITTIYKKGDIFDPANRRPITLLNNDYKVITKAINNRMKTLVDLIINDNQTGFVHKRYIMDNIITMNEIIEYCKLRGLSGLITLFDFNKAFDSISHGAIRRTLQHIKIDNKIINLIMNLLTGSTARVIVNGFLTNPIPINRGVKQGDPLSPTLFVLVIECLARAILNSKAIGLPLNDFNTMVKLLQFADDSSTFSANYKDLKLKLRIFNLFCQATSSKINPTKCCIIQIGPPCSDHLHHPPIIGDTRIPKSIVNERYLGLFFNSEGLHHSLSSIVSEVKSSLIKWKKFGTTLRTKMSILKSYTLSKLSYHMYLDKFTESDIKSLNKIITWFLWSSNLRPFEDAKSFKNTMTLSRAVHHWKNGGISLWDMKLRNDAQHIWILNRVIANQDVYSPYYQSWRNQIRHNKITSPTLKHSILLWQQFRPIMKLPPHQMKPILRNDEPLPLKLIYHDLINHHHKPVLTSGQFQLSLPPTKIDFTSTRNIFYYINSIKHHRGRNTVFRFFSRSLPGMAYIKQDSCKLCSANDFDPHTHYFFNCRVILNKFNLKHITQHLQIANYEDEWSLEKSTTHFYLCDESSDLTAIIYHNIWKHVSSILFSQDDKILDFSNQSIISDFDIHRNILKLINNTPTPAN